MSRTVAGLPAADLAAVLLRHPRLIRPALRLIPPRWWRGWPPLPVPPSDYARFRMQTMYGPDGRIDRDDLLRYLQWCRHMNAGRDMV